LSGQTSTTFTFSANFDQIFFITISKDTLSPLTFGLGEVIFFSIKISAIGFTNHVAKPVSPATNSQVTNDSENS
jgi:hypothetical protein